MIANNPQQKISYGSDGSAGIAAIGHGHGGHGGLVFPRLPLSVELASAGLEVREVRKH
jgi:hypothetical protein